MITTLKHGKRLMLGGIFSLMIGMSLVFSGLLLAQEPEYLRGVGCVRNEDGSVPQDEDIVKQTDDALYTFGNLAIIPGALNTSISNAPWPVKLEGKGKKEGLLKNAKGLATLDEYLSLLDWNLQTIKDRAKKLYSQILSAWSEPWDIKDADF